MAQKTDVELTTDAAAENPAPHESRAESAPATSQASEFFRERPHTRTFLIIAAIVLIVGGFFTWRYLSSYESTDDAQVDGHLMPISARISGYVSEVNIDDNQYVHAGDVLVEIDPRDYQVAVDQSKAALTDAEAAAKSAGLNVPVTSVSTTSQISSTEADVANAEAGIAWAQQQADAAQADLVQAQANNSKAQNDLMRYKQLVDKQEISQQLYDQAFAAAAAGDAAVAAAKSNVAAAAQQVAQAQSRLASARAAWRSAQTGPEQVAVVRAKAASADAEVQARQAALDQAELNLRYTKIVAPANGVVTKSVEVGMNVQPGQQLVSLMPLEDVWITANFKETQLKYMRVGQRAEIKADVNGRTYRGRVDSIAGSSGARLSLLPPENATGNYVKVVQRVPVKIVLDPGENSDHSLRLGMSVEPKVFVK